MVTKRVALTIKIACFKNDTTSNDKCIKTVGGIKDVLGCRLAKAGITTVGKLRKKTNKMSKVEFAAFMKDTCKANTLQSGMAYKSLYSKVTECAVENKLRKSCAKCKK